MGEADSDAPGKAITAMAQLSAALTPEPQPPIAPLDSSRYPEKLDLPRPQPPEPAPAAAASARQTEAAATTAVVAATAAGASKPAAPPPGRAQTDTSSVDQDAPQPESGAARGSAATTDTADRSQETAAPAGAATAAKPTPRPAAAQSDAQATPTPAGRQPSAAPATPEPKTAPPAPKADDTAGTAADAAESLAVISALTTPPPASQAAPVQIPGATAGARTAGSGATPNESPGASPSGGDAPIVVAAAPQTTTDAPPPEPVPSAQILLSEAALEEQLRDFLDDYCVAYAAKDLDRFTRFFAADAVENGKPFDSLLPKYQKNFDLIETIQYRIRMRDYTVADDRQSVTVEGDFFLEWLPPDRRWRQNAGKISMRLKGDGSSFLVQQLDYQGNRAQTN
jgi:hypothetical protein